MSGFLVHLADFCYLVAFIGMLLFAITGAISAILWVGRRVKRWLLADVPEHRLIPVDPNATYPTASTRRAVARARELEDRRPVMKDML